MQQLTRDELSHLQDIVQGPDELKFISTFMQIPAKEGSRAVPMRPWPVQERLIRNMGLRNLWIKDTQCGSTSIISAVVLKRTITRPYTTSILMAHDSLTTQRLLSRIDFMYASVPEELKPVIDHRSSYEKSFPDIHSVMYIATAQAAVAGRGEPIHNLIASEAAFYIPGALQRIIHPALQRVPMETGLVVLESTPNGLDEIVYPEVQRCLRGESVYKLQVVYWWDNLDNVMSARTELDIPGVDRELLNFTSEEQVLVNLYNLSKDQIRWRRFRVRESGELFWQEHLESLDTCFLTTGSPYYPATVLDEMARTCYPAPSTGPGGSAIWFPPEARGHYVMGIDPGMGKTTETVASVWRIYPKPLNADEKPRGPQHVARLAGLFDAPERRDDIWALGKWYNWALINPEANGHGQGLIRELKNYPKLYWREDIVSGVKTMVIGWLTTGRTKPFMMQVMKRMMPTMECRDATLIQQCLGFRDRGDGKVIPTTMDDHHDAACLAMVAAEDALGNPSRGARGTSGYTSWDR